MNIERLKDYAVAFSYAATGITISAVPFSLSCRLITMIAKGRFSQMGNKDFSALIVVTALGSALSVLLLKRIYSVFLSRALQTIDNGRHAPFNYLCRFERVLDKFPSY